LAKKVKITRKQIKQPDEFQSFGRRAIEYASEKAVAITGVVVGIIALILIVAGILLYMQSKEDKALDAMAGALEVYHGSQGDQAKSGDTGYENESDRYLSAAEMFESVAQKYSATDAGILALLYMGDSYYKGGDYENALTSYQGFIERFDGDESFLLLAYQGAGYSLESMEKYDLALENFEKTINPENKTLRIFGLMNAARCYEQLGQIDKAIEFLETLLQDYPTSTMKSEVSDTLEALKLKSAPMPASGS